MPNVLLIDAKSGANAATLEDAGLEVSVCPCVISGLEQARDDQPDVIVCSGALAGLTALDLLEIKSAEPSLADLRVIVADGRADEKGEHFQAGCDDFIDESDDNQELLWRVRAVLRRAGNKGVGGNFSHINIFDFIQMLVAGQSNGRLDIDCGDVFGTLCFESGQVFHASCLDLLGEDAFAALLKQTQKGGEFHFSAESVDGERNIEQRTDHLLLGLANQLDEG